MGGRLELRDLRSLERRSMYSIFHPLDPDERLPRELLVEGKRYRLPEKSTLFTIVGVAGLALLGVYAYVLGTRAR